MNIQVKENAAIGEKYYYTKHKSGLDIYVFPKKLSSSYALFGTRYGSIDNRFRIGGQTDFTEVPDGIAHYLEHKMFENEDGVDTFARFAKYGADANAYTSFNQTAYLFSCTEHFDESLEVLLDYVTHPYFTPQTVAKEQGIIGQEIRMGEDQPYRARYYALTSALYEKHNVRIQVAGTVESISKITADILYSCYNTFYNLHNMALCICGDIEVEDVLRVADKVLKPAPEQTIESVQAEEKPEVFMKRNIKKMQVAKPMFAIGVKDVDISPIAKERLRKNITISILNSMLFGRSSEFYNELYNEGLISNSFEVYYDINKAFAHAEIAGDSNDPEAVYSRMVDYIEDKKKSGLSEEDFIRCKRVTYANFVKSFDSSEQIATMLLDFVFDDSELLSYADVAASITFDDVTRALHDFYREERMAMAVIYPLDDQPQDNGSNSEEN